MLTRLSDKIKNLFSSAPNIQSEEVKLSITEVISEEFVNAIRAAAAKRVSKITISNSGVLEYLPDGSTSTSVFDTSAVTNILPKGQTFFDLLFRVIFVVFAECAHARARMYAGQMTSLLLHQRLQLESVFNVSMQYFPEEIHIYIFFNEFEYYYCQARKYQFFADCLNSYSDIISNIMIEAKNGLFSLTISPDRIRSITHYDDSESPISTESYVISRLEKTGFKIEKELITMAHFKYKISWTAKEFKITDVLNEADIMQKFLKELKGDYSTPADDRFHSDGYRIN